MCRPRCLFRHRVVSKYHAAWLTMVSRDHITIYGYRFTNIKVSHRHLFLVTGITRGAVLFHYDLAKPLWNVYALAHQEGSHYSNQYWLMFMTSYGVIRSQFKWAQMGWRLTYYPVNTAAIDRSYFLLFPFLTLDSINRFIMYISIKNSLITITKSSCCIKITILVILL